MRSPAASTVARCSNRLPLRKAGLCCPHQFTGCAKIIRVAFVMARERKVDILHPSGDNLPS